MNESPPIRRTPATSAALALLVAALLGMAYTHIKDVGMKFDEHVYYMAYLFCANIVASVAFAAFAVACYGFGSAAWLRRTLAATVGLVLSTVAGFVWSRTIGFPQMADHIGQWDTLGITSLVCEGIALLVSGVLLAGLRSGGATLPTAVRRRRKLLATTAVGVLLVVALSAAAAAFADGGMGGMDGMDGMRIGNMAEYPDLAGASAANLARVRSLHLRANAMRAKFATPAKARRLGYRTNPAERKADGCPSLVHFRRHGSHFGGKLLDPAKPQAIVFWCDARHRFTYVASMYRAPVGSMPPTFGNLIGWHRHGMRGTWMTHVWMAKATRDALATCVPFRALRASVGAAYAAGYAQDIPGSPDGPCSDTQASPAG